MQRRESQPGKLSESAEIQKTRWQAGQNSKTFSGTLVSKDDVIAKPASYAKPGVKLLPCQVLLCEA